MDSVIKITDGRVIDVDETLQGLKAFRNWETDDVDKRVDAILDFMDGIVKHVFLIEQTIIRFYFFLFGFRMA